MKLYSSLTALFYLRSGTSTAFVHPRSHSSSRHSGGTTGQQLRNAVAEEIVIDTENSVSASGSALTTADAQDGAQDADVDADPTITTTSNPLQPGLNENDLFECDASVGFWRNFQYEEGGGGDWTTQQNLQEIANIATRFASLGPNAWSYWLKHAGRSGYFVGNAVLGTLGSSLHERLVNNSNDDSTSIGGGLPVDINSSVATTLLLNAFLCYEQDYNRIKAGEYLPPWDMELNHRQSSPLNVMTQTSRFVNEAIGTLGRSKRQRTEDKQIWITDSAAPKLYPEYYRTAYHYQTDGWMSQKSANVYETSTETLFLGRQDAMQRTTLTPLVSFAKEYAKKQTKGQIKVPMKVLEVACGTGRFMTFVRDNLPLDTECTAVDLSPFYLDKARDNDLYWRKTARARVEEEGDSSSIKPLRLVQAQAENLPFDSESFDAVICVYLYHELPRDVRATVSAEMSRVLKKDGMLVLTDSVQAGDRPALDGRLQNFEKMNEPYYVDYCQDDLPGHFTREGLKPLGKIVRSTTKSLSFKKE